MNLNRNLNLFHNKVRLGHAHVYHIVTSSPWPYNVAWGLFILLFGSACLFHNYPGFGLFGIFPQLSIIGGLILFLTVFQWIRDIIREASFIGAHSYIVQRSIRLGIYLFILSEVLFFFSFFWAFFHSSLSPTVAIGCVWPPQGLLILHPWSVPFANTLILLYSGISITYAHHALVIGKDLGAINRGFLITLIAAYVFMGLQFFEYTFAPFTISDGVYGSAFFLTTGFHGAHVIIGSFLILFCYERHKLKHFTLNHIVGFEAAAWYWHFVDVVWLFVFTFLYWWGGSINLN